MLAFLLDQHFLFLVRYLQLASSKIYSFDGLCIGLYIRYDSGSSNDSLSFGWMDGWLDGWMSSHFLGILLAVIC